MKDNSSITFSVIKYSWGIFIQIEAIIEDLLEKNSESFENISNNIHLKINEVIRLSIDEREMIINGLKSIQPEIENDKKYLIHIKQIHFNYCDFQIEGLFWAAKMLASDLFDQEFTMPEIHFNKKENKYVFVG